MNTRTLLFSVFSFCLLALYINPVMAQDIDEEDDIEELAYDKEQFNLLKRGAKVWNAYRTAFPDKPINMVEAPLAGMNLSNCNLAGGDFTEADLRGVNLVRANMEGAIFNGADIGEFNLTVADMTDANLDNAEMRECDITGARFINTKMTGIDLTGSSLVGVNLRKAIMRNAILDETDLENCRFERTIIIGASMEDIDNLRAAKMKEVIRKEEDMHYYNLPDVEYPDDK